MEPTPRLRVLSNRIPWVLVFVYFCRGLSGNTEERPTRRVYIEILTCCAIFYHLEDSKSHGKEAEVEDSGTGRPPSFPGRPPSTRVQSGLSFGILLHRPKGSRITIQSMSVWSNGSYSLEGTIKPDPPGPWRSYLFYRIKARVSILHQSREDPFSSSSSTSSPSRSSSSSSSSRSSCSSSSSS